MTAIASSFFPANLKGTLQKDTNSIDWNGDTFKVALYTDSLNGPTTTAMATDAGTYTVAPWDAGAQRATDSLSSYVINTAGCNLTTPTVTVSGTFPGAGKVIFSDGTVGTPNNKSWAGTTFATHVQGALVYSDTAAPKLGLCFVNFGAGPYTTSNGTFTINWNTTNGIAYFSF